LSLLLVFFEGGEGEELLFPNFRSRRERERKGEKKKLREREREEREEEKKNLWSGILFSSFESDRHGRWTWATTGSCHHAKSLSHPRASLPCHIPTFTMGSRLIGISRLYTLKRKKKGRRRANCGGGKRGLRAAAR